MAKKKNTSISVSQEDNVQAENILTQYQQIANNLHVSTNQEQAEAALGEINSLPEGSQMAFLKGLSKENHVDAADVLLAIYELSPLKSVRKEARRSLIRLEGAKIYPGWKPPLTQSTALSILQSTNPPRFWKGFVTNSMSTGQVQLILCWEQGDDYREVRFMAFLLDFTHEGVKDSFSEYESKRSFEKYMAEVKTELEDMDLKNCTLAQGRRLLLNALAINKQFGTTLPTNYRLNLSLINQLILEVPELDDEDDELIFDDEYEEVDIHNLVPTSVVSIFVESHIGGNFSVSYDLLTQDSPLREGLSKDEWMKRRKAWEQTANPGEVEPNFIFEHEQPKSRLWLPSSHNASRKKGETTIIEVGWSAELDDTPLGEALPELPYATAVYAETRRHWFWVSYSLQKENDEWRLHSISDEGLNAHNLSIEELQKRISDANEQLNKTIQKYKLEEVKRLPPEQQANIIQEIPMYAMHSLSLTDELIKKVPLDRELYRDASESAIITQKFERSLVYLLPLVQRFPEEHAPLLRQISAVYREVSEKFSDQDDEERTKRFDKLAEEALHESLAIENSFGAHISLVHILIEEDERLDEAEDHLIQAKELASDTDEEAHVEMHLGEIAAEQEKFEEALTHYQRVAELQPEEGASWSNVALAHRNLDNLEEAITNYQHAIELEPDNIDYHYGLARLYNDTDQFEKVVKLLADAIVANPDSANFNALLASFYMEKGDYRHAEIFMKKAERLDPEADSVQILRPFLEAKKLSPEITASPTAPRKFLKQKHK